MHLEKEAKRVNNEHHDTKVLHTGRMIYIKFEILQKKNIICDKIIFAWCISMHLEKEAKWLNN